MSSMEKQIYYALVLFFNKYIYNLLVYIYIYNNISTLFLILFIFETVKSIIKFFGLLLVWLIYKIYKIILNIFL